MARALSSSRDLSVSRSSRSTFFFEEKSVFEERSAKDVFVSKRSIPRFDPSTLSLSTLAASANRSEAR